MLDEEQLIAAVARVRTGGSASTATEVHAALVAEGHADLSISQGKKASSKATKRQLQAEVTPLPKASAPVPEANNVSKREAKAAKAAESTMKAAETHMMSANRALRIALGDDEYSAAIATADRGERFIQMVTQRALEAKLTPAEALVPRERLAADLATLEWMQLAENAGTLTLPEDARAGVAAQIERLASTRASAAFRADRSWA